MTVPLSDQLACVKRELMMRRSVYPRLVSEGKMTQATADRQTQAMQAVFETLMRLQKEQEPSLL